MLVRWLERRTLLQRRTVGALGARRGITGRALRLENLPGLLGRSDRVADSDTGCCRSYRRHAGVEHRRWPCVPHRAGESCIGITLRIAGNSGNRDPDSVDQLNQGPGHLIHCLFGSGRQCLWPRYHSHRTRHPSSARPASCLPGRRRAPSPRFQKPRSAG